MADSVIDSAIETSSNMTPRGVDSRSDMPEGFIHVILRELLTATITTQGKPSEGLVKSDSTVMKELSDCIRNEDCDRLLEMVDDHAELFLQVEDTQPGWTALHVAVLKRSAALVTKLLRKLKNSPSVEEKTILDFCRRVDKYYKLSAFQMALVIGDFTIVEAFLYVIGVEKAPVFLPRDHSDAAMDPEALHKVRQLLKSILDKQGVEKTVWNSGESMREVKIVSWGQAINMTGDDPAPGYEFCFHQSIRNFCDRHGFLKFILQEAVAGNLSSVAPVLTLRNDTGHTVLHLLAGATEVGLFGYFFRELIQHFPGLNMNVEDSLGRTPLHIAAALGHADVVELLVENRRTNVNALFYSDFDFDQFVPDNSPQYFDNCVFKVTALHLAVIHNHVEAVQALLDAPTTRDHEPLDINLGCACGTRLLYYTSFQMAASKGHVQILQLLLKDPRLHDPGLKGSALEPTESPALHKATEYFQPWAMKALVESEQINTFATNWEGNTALHHATRFAGSPLKTIDNLMFYVSLDHFRFRPPFAPRNKIDQDIIACMHQLCLCLVLKVCKNGGLRKWQKKHKNTRTVSLLQQTPSL